MSFDEHPENRLVLSLRIRDHSQPITLPTSFLTLNSLSNKNLSDLLNIISQDELQNKINYPIDTEESIPISARQLQRIEERKDRYKLQREIITIAKKAIKPSYKKRYITKDEYKIIMKKVVTKAVYSNKIDQKWIDKSINSYVRKYRAKHAK